MKKFFAVAGIAVASVVQAQFSVTVQAPAEFKEQQAVLYTLNGSKDLIFTQQKKNNNAWIFKFPTRYVGMMKVYFPTTNNTVTFISENKNVQIDLQTLDDKVKNVLYRDEANATMQTLQESEQKREMILPALSQIKEYYADQTEFGAALKKEISQLSGKKSVDAVKFPFIAYYNSNYARFLAGGEDREINAVEVAAFINTSNEMLETSSLLRPLLVAYLNSIGKQNLTSSIDQMLASLNVESPRGQTVLSELIDIFDVYDMPEHKSKYLTLAKNLKCTIHDRLASTLKSNANVELGATFPNYTFVSPTNTSAKSIYDVKASKKVIVFWSSTCSHCEKELPDLLQKYRQLQAQNIQVIAMSMDVERDAYQKKIVAFPWINDTELKGWNSSYTDTYNIHATPSYFILDANNKIISKPDHATDVLDYLGIK